MILVPVVMGLAVWQARVTRRATLDALDRAVAAMREMRTREAQLEEANRDLDFLMRMAAGRAGPYTGLMAGRYAIRHLIARGAMGEVYAATDTDGGGDAAIKLLQSSMLRDEQLVARFLREGEAASKLEGPNVVTIYEVGTIGANGAPYIAMELLRGHDLAWHLRQRGALPLDEVVGLAEHVAGALEAARKAGIVHRDLKPQNLFLAQQNAAAPVWKILDFGVSRLAGTTGTLTMDMVVGTPGYMSPEQAAGGVEVTHRSDVFSFGAVLYRALTGQPPFSGPDTPQILYQVVYKNPPRPSQLVPGLPADVEMVLIIGMAKDPGDRFATAVEMAEALRTAAKGRLDPSHRVHARTILAALPWNTSSRDESEVELIEIEDSHWDGTRAERTPGLPRRRRGRHRESWGVGLAFARRSAGEHPPASSLCGALSSAWHPGVPSGGASRAQEGATGGAGSTRLPRSLGGALRRPFVTRAYDLVVVCALLPPVAGAAGAGAVACGRGAAGSREGRLSRRQRGPALRRGRRLRGGGHRRPLGHLKAERAQRGRLVAERRDRVRLHREVGHVGGRRRRVLLRDGFLPRGPRRRHGIRGVDVPLQGGDDRGLGGGDAPDGDGRAGADVRLHPRDHHPVPLDPGLLAVVRVAHFLFTSFPSEAARPGPLDPGSACLTLWTAADRRMAVAHGKIDVAGVDPRRWMWEE